MATESEIIESRNAYLIAEAYTEKAFKDKSARDFLAAGFVIRPHRIGDGYGFHWFKRVNGPISVKITDKDGMFHDLVPNADWQDHFAIEIHDSVKPVKVALPEDATTPERALMYAMAGVFQALSTDCEVARCDIAQALVFGAVGGFSHAHKTRRAFVMDSMDDVFTAK